MYNFISGQRPFYVQANINLLVNKSIINVGLMQRLHLVRRDNRVKKFTQWPF